MNSGASGTNCEPRYERLRNAHLVYRLAAEDRRQALAALIKTYEHRERERERERERLQREHRHSGELH